MDKRTLIAFVLIGLVFFFYGDFIRWMYPPPPAPPGSDSLSVMTDSSVNSYSTPIPAREGTGEISAVDGYVDGILDTMDSYAPVIATAPVRNIHVSTDRYNLRMTTDGAQIESLELKPFKSYMPDNVQMIPGTPGSRFAFRFWTRDGPVETTSLMFTIEGDESSDDVELRVSGNRVDSLKLIAPLQGGRALRLVYTFTGDKFQTFCRVEGIGTENLWVRDYAEVIWTGGLRYTEETLSQDHQFSKAYTYFAGDILEDQGVEDKSKLIGPSEGQTRWAAVRTKYFMIAMLPEQAEGIGSWIENRFDSTRTDKYPPNRLGVGIRLPIAEGSITTPVRLFAGPIDDQLLEELDPTLKRSMSFGWAFIRPISLGILWGLKAMHTVIPNYGICIIIFSILIKLVTWPLNAKQYTSMQGMQKIQPKLTAIREKYKSDPARLNKEMMALYKEEKINPMGGCWPMLLQIPIIFAMFTVMQSTIEFRHAPFMLWITDLSLPDYVFALPFNIPIYGSHFAILPVLMSLSTYFQSKATMTDPNQKMFIYIAPIMMLLFFNSFPSGLNLYYTLLNVFTSLQQKLMTMKQTSVQSA